VSEHKPIPQELLDQLAYDETSPTGLRWTAPKKGRRPGVCGTATPAGYSRLRFGQHFFRCHRLVWALHHGDPGALVVDHINEVRSDNRIGNLQAIEAGDNKLRRTGRGYSFDKRTGRWMASVKVGRVNRFLGRFDTEEEARAAYVGAKLVAAKGLTPQVGDFSDDT